MHIHYLLTDLNGAGAALPVPELVRVMHDEGHTVRVLALLPRDRKACAQLDRAGVRWELLGGSAGNVIGSSRALLRVLAEDRPDLIWTSLTRATIYGSIAGKLLGIPVVSWQHNTWLKPGNRLLLRLTRSLTGLWVADSRTVAEFAAQTLGIAPGQIEVWPLIRARAAAPLAQPCPPGARFRVGSLGRLVDDKRFCHLIEAASLIRERDPQLAAQMEFVIGGQGSALAALAAQVARSGLENVHFLGFVEDVPAFLATLHAYAQPSHHEGLCIAAHEAMQAGLPVVATRVGELQHSVLPGITGALCEVGDVPALATALMALAREPARAATLGRAGRERVLNRFGDAEFRNAGQTVLLRAEALTRRVQGGALRSFPHRDPTPRPKRRTIAATADSIAPPPQLWLLLNDKPGEDAQLRSIAAALGWPVVEWHPGAAPQAPPWPDVVLSFGRGVVAARRLRRQAGGRTRLVQVGRSRGAPLRDIDLLIALPQDRMFADAKVLLLRMPLNRQRRDAPNAARLAGQLAALPRPWTALIVGGSAPHFVFDAESAAVIGVAASRHALDRGGSLLVSTSPRTPRETLMALRKTITAPSHHYEFRINDADNPLAAYLALADDLIVTGDSASLLAEAWRSGKPVYVAPLPAKNDLRQRLFKALRRVLPGVLQDALQREGLISPQMDLPSWQRQLVAQGWTAWLGAPPAAPSYRPELDDDLQRIVERVQALMR